MLGENIRNLRKENKISQEDLAEKLGVSRQSISLWENGQTQPTIENIVAIAGVFGVTTDDIIKDKSVESDNVTVADVAIEVLPKKKHLEKFKLTYLWIFISIVVLSLIFYIIGNRENKIEKLSSSVLMINIYDMNDELSATGSGFVVFEDDILVTNYHVIEDAYKIEAVDESDVTYSLNKIVAYDKEKDLAILRFSRHTDLKRLKLYDSSKVSKGDDVIAIGSPIGLKNTVSKGIISSIRKDGNIDILQITAPISPGSSGGVLLNKKGKVIGVTFAGIEDGQNINFALPSNEVLNLYKYKSNEIEIQDFFYKTHKIEIEETSKSSIIESARKAAEEERAKRQQYPDENNGVDIVTVKHILVQDYDLAKSLLNRIKNGEDFDKLMYKYTEDSTGLENNPNGYTFARGVMIYEFEKASFSLEVGEISGVVKSDYGYHIIQRIK